MIKNSSFISLDCIREIFEDQCSDIGFDSSNESFGKFVEYLEIDIYDWVSENFRSFTNDQISESK